MDLSVLIHHIPCQVTSTAAEYITLNASNTTMLTAGAKRTAAYRVREKLKHETPEELDKSEEETRVLISKISSDPKMEEKEIHKKLEKYSCKGI
jgi:hypothetical protein